jgi:hypothetical protein
MRNWWFACLVMGITLVLAGSVFADLCSDTDDGPTNPSSPPDDVLSTKGSVKYGITTLYDTCLTGKEGISADEGVWLREYYCANDQRTYKEYDCTAYGFQGCAYGACTNKTSQSQPQDQNQTTQAFCGDKYVDKTIGEECDPPNSICFGKDVSEYGQCDSNCKCQLAHHSETQSVCGDGTLDPGEECEFDSDCETGKICDLCVCIIPPSQNVTNQTTQNVTNQTEPAVPTNATNMATNETAANETVNETNKTAIPEFEAPEIGNVTDFSEEPGIKVTSGVARFFLDIWNWFVGLFQ